MEKSDVANRVQSVREERGMSAATLAKAAGVSRQTIHAVEAGSYVPNTTTGLRMARALGVTVEELFSLVEKETLATKPAKARVVGAPETLHTGQAVQLGKVSGKLVAASAEPHDWCFPESDGVLDGLVAADGWARVRVHDSEADFGRRILLAGCDPAMGLVAQSLERAGTEVVLVHQNSSRALSLLRNGLAHVAGSHLSGANGDSNADAVRMLFPARSAAMVSFAVWQEGLVTAAGNPKGIKGVEDLARRDVRFVNREAGSGSRALIDRHLKRLGVSQKGVRGYEKTAAGHLAVAGKVMRGAADCGVSTEPAARFLGLTFVALESVRYDLVVKRQHLDSNPIQKFFNVISGLAFRHRLGRSGAYDTSVTGSRRI